MFMQLRKSVVFCWDFVFNHEVSPLRHIPDVAVRHYILQLLGLMWAVAFAAAAGSYTLYGGQRDRSYRSDSGRSYHGSDVDGSYREA